MADLDMVLVTKYARETARKRRLEAALRETQARLDATEPQVLQALQAAEVTSIKDQQGRTLYLQSELWVNAAKVAGSEERDHDAANSWLERNGLGEFVRPRFSVMAVSAWAREVMREKGELPSDFETAFELKGGYRVRVRGTSPR